MVTTTCEPPTPYLFDSGLTLAEVELVRLALDLGAAEAGGPLSDAEGRLLSAASAVRPTDTDALDATVRAIRAAEDPLGDAFCQLRSQIERRRLGAFYTPSTITEPMVDWVLARDPKRVVDAGCGSGRFAAAVARREPALPIVAIDVDPLATILTRATLATLGTRGARVVNEDYTRLALSPTSGRTGFIGNPPYVRHHALPLASKTWASATARRLGHSFSRLAGLHAHFFLATAAIARPGDVGCFVTSSEWLDIGYGSVIRDLLANGLGATAIHAIDPSVMAFDAQATAVIACFQVGASPERVRIRRVHSTAELMSLDVGVALPRNRFLEAGRWTNLLTESSTEDGPARRLGDLVGVHRGLVTGANSFFVMTRERATALGLASWCRPTITDAREIIDSGGVVHDSPSRKVLLAVPRDVDRRSFPDLDAYLRLGEMPSGNARAVASRYIPSHRRPWWYLGRFEAPPIVATYMARQPPAFARNPDGLALLNIGHGLYPRRPLTEERLSQLVIHLNESRGGFRGRGRTYQGGLEKFEPREMEALMVNLTAEEGFYD
jgi:hypothetical protein